METMKHGLSRLFTVVVHPHAMVEGLLVEVSPSVVLNLLHERFGREFNVFR